MLNDTSCLAFKNVLPDTEYFHLHIYTFIPPLHPYITKLKSSKIVDYFLPQTLLIQHY